MVTQVVHGGTSLQGLSRVDREVEGVLQKAKTWNDIVDAAQKYANRNRIRPAIDLLERGARLYPEHEKDFIDVNALVVGNFLRSKRGPGH
jgi:hypothetical protein